MKPCYQSAHPLVHNTSFFPIGPPYQQPDHFPHVVM